jgi:TRAP transporter TAXI family solute receptor
MKKFLSLFTAVSIICGLLSIFPLGVTFLWIHPADAALSADEMPSFDYNITMPTGSMGGSYYTIGSAMSELFTSNMKGVTISSSAANTSDNIASLNDKEAILAMAGAPDYVFLLDELPTDSTEISSIGVFNQLVSVIVVKEGSNYQKIDDLVGKKINLGSAGSGQYLFNKALLNAAGYSESDFQCEYMSQGDASEAFAEGKLEAVFAFISLPASAITQMAVTTKCRILQLDENFLSNFLDKYTYYKTCEVTPEVVPGMGVARSYQTGSQYGELLVRNDTDEEFVYWLTRTLYENYDALIASAPGASVCTAENSVKYSAFNIHPGAQRYFKEKGLLK